MDIRLVHRTVGTTPVLDVSGDLDLATVPRFHTELATVVADLVRTSGDASGIPTGAVDLDGVTSFDDAALGVLLGAAGRAREGGARLVVVCTDPRLLARFTLTRLDRAVDIAPTVAAVSQVSPAAPDNAPSGSPAGDG
jgi:anti-anti-sigma factor